MKKILIVDDELIIREGFAKTLEMQGFTTLKAKNASEAYSIFQQEELKVVLLDVILPDVSGLEILKKIKDKSPNIQVIMITSYVDVNTAVEAIKLGAYDFIVKPPDFEKLKIILDRAIESFELRQQVETSYEFLLGKDPAIKNVLSQIHRIAKRDISVVVQGETGTGKTYIANVIHNLSHRSDNPFIQVDIGTLNENIIESELFGYEKGAFTGANNLKKGYFEQANKGTIFIDELENMSSQVQTKFLRIVEDNQLYRVGSTKPSKIDVRFITATNKDLKKNVIEKKFREDLYYRLAEFVINIPPLRERPKDIEFFVHKFILESSTDDLGKHVNSISESALDYLNQHTWPGNIRELKAVIKRAIIFCDNHMIEKEHIKFFDESIELENEQLSITSTIIPLKEKMKLCEIQTLKEALLYTNGNKTKTAKLLKIDYTTLLRKLKEYEIK